MSVKQWKRVITLTVLIIIVTLLVLTVKFISESRHYGNLLDDGKLVDLTEFGDMDAKELTGIFNYLSSLQNVEYQAYHDMYPDLYVKNDFNFIDNNKKTCYLTFDDGPDSQNTAAILDILKKNKIKATFFLEYDDTSAGIAMYKRIASEGHALGIHTASHDYEYIYSSMEAFLEDFNKSASFIEEATGVKPSIYRFPAGSINIYNKTNYRQFISEVIRRGYVYYDWNASSADDSSYTDVEEITKTALAQSEGKDKVILLLHDGSGQSITVNALPEIIKGLQQKGYSFAALDNTVAPYCFGY